VRAETTWTRTRKDGQVGCDEEGSEWVSCFFSAIGWEII
jgi:hypothetical protein